VSTYREIVGKKIKKVSSDPSAGTDGEMWYNSTTGSLRGLAITEAWASASALNTAVYYNCGAGDQTAALSFQGTAGPNPSTSTQTEEYNGSGWATGGATPVAKRSGMGAGTQTAGLSAGGATAPGTASTSTDEYNGTAWTSVNALSTGRRYTAGCGTQTAAICTGGQNPGGTQIDSTEEYDGTNWTSGGAWPKTIRQEVLLGTQTATLGAGGYSTVIEVEAYEYDGSSWTATGDMNQQRYVFQGFGTQTVGIVCGGEPAPDAATKTESYDGATFSTSPATLGNPTAQAASGVASPGTAGIVFGDAAGGTAANTEEYTKSTNVITAAAWSSGANFPTTSSNVAGAGPRDAGLGIGGYPAGSPPTGKSFEYNGVAWSAEATLNPSTGTQGVSGAAGTQTACICAQNTTPAPPFQYKAAGEYDGSSWSNANARPADNYSNAMCGTQTAGLIFGGTSSPTGTSAVTLSYDGTNWTAEESMSTARSELSGSGTATAGLGAGGYSNPPSTVYANTEEYGGESWTAGGALLSATRSGRSSGTQTDCIYMGGGNPSLPLGTVACLTYDGTSWVTAPSMATTRSMQGNGATSPVGAAWGAAGYSAPGTPNRTNTTEHFNVETTAANVKTFSTS